MVLVDCRWYIQAVQSRTNISELILHKETFHTKILSVAILDRFPGTHPMGRLRLVGSIKLQVSFAREPYNRDYILQKRPIISSTLLNVATPYPKRTNICVCVYIYIYMHVRMYVRMYVCIHTYVHVCVCVYVHIFWCIHMCML